MECLSYIFIVPYLHLFLKIFAILSFGMLGIVLLLILVELYLCIIEIKHSSLKVLSIIFLFNT